jgi:hypothetical protein
MSAPPLNSTAAEMWYKFNYTLPGVDIKKISNNFDVLWLKNLLQKPVSGL